jgi:uncharacterized protein (TIGR02001 family)
MFKKTLIAGAAAAALSLPGVVFAADAAPADAKPAEPKPSYTLTGNFGVFSQYIFRGLTQTNGKPAAQGGFDWAHESGFYAGTWMSNISWPKENFSQHGAGPAGTNIISGTYEAGGSLEADFYGGYKWSLPQDFGIDVGTLYYWYPGDTSAALERGLNGVPVPGFASLPKLDTWEVYVAGTWKWASVKYSYSVLDHTFGTLNSRGTGYLDLSANPPLGDTGVTLNLHFGYQKYKGTDPRNMLFTVPGGGSLPAGAIPSNDTLLTYKDVKVGLTYALPKDFSIGAFYSKSFGYNTAGYGGINDPVYGGFGPYPKDIAKGTGTLFVQKTF